MDSHISYKTLMRMHGNYEKDKQDHLSRHYKKKETKSIWFSMDELKPFLQELIDASGKLSGLRVYLCQHDKDSVPAGCDPKEYIGKLTVGFVATKHNDKTGNEDDEIGTPESKLIVVDPYDQGKICPPDICPV